MDWRGLRVTVFGMARSGLAAVELLLRHAAPSCAAPTPDRWPDCLRQPGDSKRSAWALFRRVPRRSPTRDVIVLSPGVPPDLPLLEQARTPGSA